MFVWLWLVVNDRKFPAETVFFSHTNQPTVLLHEPATKRTSQPNMLIIRLTQLKPCSNVDHKLHIHTPYTRPGIAQILSCLMKRQGNPDPHEQKMHTQSDVAPERNFLCIQSICKLQERRTASLSVPLSVSQR